MGILHKTLDDAKKALTKGDLNRAYDILASHLAEHILAERGRDFAMLKNWLEEYTKGIETAVDDIVAKNPQEAIKKIDHAKRDLDQFIALLRKMEKEGKIELG